MFYSGTIELRTSSSMEFIDITDKVSARVKASKVKEGIVTIFTKHTTTAITINENESRLLRDFKGALKSLLPKGKGYEHDQIDDNAHSHLRSVFLGASEAVPIIGGRTQLGTWQRIFLVELDGPRTRNVIVQVQGES